MLFCFICFIMFVDEECFGIFGLMWFGVIYLEVFDGVIEVISEVGGFFLMML